MTTPCGLSSWCGLAILGVEGALAASFRRDRAARRLAKCDGGNDNYGFDAKPEQSPALHRHRSCLPSAGETAIVRFRFSLEFAAQARFLVTPFYFFLMVCFCPRSAKRKSGWRNVRTAMRFILINRWCCLGHYNLHQRAASDDTGRDRFPVKAPEGVRCAT